MTCSGSKKNSNNFRCLSCNYNSILYEKTNACLTCVIRNKYVNYYQNNCIDEIPDGYYLFDENDKRIDKCYITCKTCNGLGNSIDHKCLECHDAYPYNYNNGEKCLDDCFKESLYSDDETKICYTDCSYNVNEKKFNYKNKCVSKNETPKNYLLDENNNFISKCNSKTQFEFNNECYDSCPEGTKLDIYEKTKNICICNNLYYLNGEYFVCVNSNICPTDYPYLKINTKECINYLVTYKDEYLLSCPNNTCITPINPSLTSCVDKLEYTNILNDICFDDFLLNIDYFDNLSSNKTIVINNNPGVSLQIYQDDLEINQFKYNYSNLTYLNLGECHDKLIDFYHLNKNEILYIISVDSLTKISSKSTNDYSFQIYLENGTQLKDLSACKDTLISISFPIINEDIVNFNLAEYFYEQGYDIYDLNSNFYNEKCTSVNINNSDIIIHDRLNDIYPSNASICPNNCKLNSTDIKFKRFNCLCKINTLSERNNRNKDGDEDTESFDINIDNLKKSFIDLKNINIYILKCYKLLFTKKGLLYNIGSYIIIFTFFIYIINTFLFCFKGYKSLYNIIELILKKGKEYNANNKKNEKKYSSNKGKSIFKESKKKTFKSNKLALLEGINDIIINDENKKDNHKKEKKVLKINRNQRKRNNTNYNRNNSKNILSNNSLKSKKDKKSNKKSNNYRNIRNIKNKTKIKNDETNILSYNDYELNGLTYENALKYDKRTFIKYYFSLLKQKHLILFSFFPNNDYNSTFIKICLFFFTFSLNLTVNALFFNDSTMHKIYQDKGKFDFIYHIPQILYSTLITATINFLIKFLALSEKNIIDIKNSIKKYNNLTRKEIENEIRKKIKCINIKFIFFFIISYIFIVFFWFYLSCFCTLYNKTQIHLIKDTISSFFISLIYPVFLNLLPMIMRIIALKSNKRQLLYKFSKIIQLI